MKHGKQRATRSGRSLTGKGKAHLQGLQFMGQSVHKCTEHPPSLLLLPLFASQPTSKPGTRTGSCIQNWFPAHDLTPVHLWYLVCAQKAQQPPNWSPGLSPWLPALPIAFIPAVLSSFFTWQPESSFKQ